MKEGTDSNAVSLGMQTMCILFVSFFPLVVGIESAQTMEIRSATLTQTINEGKAQIHPILIVGRDVYGTRIQFLNNPFHIFLYLIIYR